MVKVIPIGDHWAASLILEDFQPREEVVCWSEKHLSWLTGKIECQYRKDQKWADQTTVRFGEECQVFPASSEALVLTKEQAQRILKRKRSRRAEAKRRERIAALSGKE